MQVPGCTVIVTGGSSGLGAACAQKLVALGGRVIIADLNAEAGERLAQELGSAAAFYRCDVSSTESVQSAINLGRDRFGSLQGVINCAGVLAASRVVGKEGPHDLDVFRRVIEVNLIGSFNVARLAADAMQANTPDDQGERGVIIFTSSVAAFEGQIGQAAYSASKGGVASLVLPMARELGKLGIRAMAIAPGVFNTPMMQAAPEAVRNSLQDQIPFPSRFGDPAEYADLAIHILQNPLLNGTTIRLDGALRMGPK
jgi:NAD(P)-dependent dehydrogenase (short-subunit alcohol dehydrogenase family)